MKKLFRLSIAAFTFGLVASAGQPVELLLTATMKNHVSVDLSKDDIRVYEEGKPQKVIAVSDAGDLPLSTVLLLDTSGSNRSRLATQQNAVTQFVRSQWKPRRGRPSLDQNLDQRRGKNRA